MILVSETQTQFGYLPSDLSNGSHKKVLIQCDYCGTRLIKTMKTITKEHSKLNKDACKTCRYKKRNEIELKLYGTTNPFQRTIVKNKIKQTQTEKYGGYYVETQEFKEKAKQTNIKKRGVEYACQSKSWQDNVYQTKLNNGIIKLFDGKTMNEWAEQNNYAYTTFTQLVNKYGFEEASSMINIDGPTSIEQKIINLLDNEKIAYKYQFKVQDKIADFYLSDHNLIIEADGNFWHSDKIQKDRLYHVNKRKLYIENGYYPLFFREDEIENKFEIVKSIILNKIGKSNRIYARECEIRKIDKKLVKEFLNENHLMGAGAGTAYGLCYKNELVTAIRIKGNEISRFCHKLNTIVVGGFSKLLTYIGISNITTFIDLRYGSGEYLTELGFIKMKTYPSFKWTNGRKVFHRMKFPGDTGYEAGLAKLWDCGQAKFKYI